MKPLQIAPSRAWSARRSSGVFGVPVRPGNVASTCIVHRRRDRILTARGPGCRAFAGRVRRRRAGGPTGDLGHDQRLTEPVVNGSAAGSRGFRGIDASCAQRRREAEGARSRSPRRCEAKNAKIEARLELQRPVGPCQHRNQERHSPRRSSSPATDRTTPGRCPRSATGGPACRGWRRSRAAGPSRSAAPWRGPAAGWRRWRSRSAATPTMAITISSGSE